MSGADARPDHRSFPAECATCGQPLPEIAGDDYLACQVFDLPVPMPLIVTEHRAHRCRCTACGTATRADFPEAVVAPVQYGAPLSVRW